ncbi:unnamed protein product [Paramecium sonneborni]|uniref:Uncharacterized protein n=1 Tax=Paramecium sonneborni TaxID=65129 RepID=A0A8S1N2T5_9CILI|nr:unnamed protein product [Paramecium sonneborni]
MDSKNKHKKYNLRYRKLVRKLRNFKQWFIKFFMVRIRRRSSKMKKTVKIYGSFNQKSISYNLKIVLKYIYRQYYKCFNCFLFFRQQFQDIHNQTAFLFEEKFDKIKDAVVIQRNERDIQKSLCILTSQPEIEGFYLTSQGRTYFLIFYGILGERTERVRSVLSQMDLAQTKKGSLFYGYQRMSFLILTFLMT